MDRGSASAQKLIMELAALSQRLAENDVVVTSLHCDWGAFGSWKIQAEQGTARDKYSEGLSGPNPILAIGPYVLKCTWDCRDRTLVITGSPTRALCAPNQWALELSAQVDSHYEAMGRAEKFVLERFGSR